MMVQAQEEIGEDEAVYKEGMTIWVTSSSDEALDKEDTSKQGRINEIDVDKDISLVSTHDNVSTQDNIVQDEGREDVGEEEVVEVVTTAKIIIEAVVGAIQVTTAIADILVSSTETIVMIVEINMYINILKSFRKIVTDRLYP
nr:hypothetical protein [Tanacetum cinerariifolium]